VNARQKALVCLPPVALLVAMAAIAWQGTSRTVEMPPLVLFLTVVFVAIVCFPIAAMAARSYLARGDPGLVWLCSGAIVWAFSGLVANLLSSGSINAAVTAHNLLALVSAGCHLVGAFVGQGGTASAPGSWKRLNAAVFGALCAVALVSVAAGAELLPRFFVPGEGGTPLRYAVLGSATLMFAISAALLVRDRGYAPTSFAQWYGIGLLTIAIGMSAVMLQTYPRSTMAWVGRIAQVVGTAYMLVAAIVAARSARALGLPVAIALHEAEKRFDDLVEMAADGVVVSDQGGGGAPRRIRRANPAAAALLGYSAQGMLDLSLDDLVAPAERGQLAADMAAIGREGRLMLEKTLVARDGRELPVEINARLVRFDGRETVVSILHDLRERRRSDAQRAHLAAIVEHSGDAIIAGTLDGVVTDWNRGATALFGHGADSIVGQSLAALFAPDHLDAGQPMREALAHGRPLREFETVGIRSDGTTVPVAVTMSPIRDRADRLTGFSIIARDVTAKRRSEQYLARAKAAAEEANRAKSTFLANMSHEIRTPLHNIIGLAELLRRDETQPAQQQRLRTLLETADHMLSVVNGILELSRIEAHRVAIDHRDFDLAEVVDGAVAVVRQPALAKGLDVVVRIAPELRGVVLRGDGLRIRQVLINLASNAVKFTDRGSIAVSAQCVSRTPGTATVRFVVQDTGIGIRRDDQERVFKAFEQAYGSTARAYGGSGLGLAICDGLVQAMGGRLALTSEPGRGSTFEFALTLPLGSPLRQDAPSGVSERVRFDGSHVLVADDNALGRELLRQMLVDLGCAVDVAADGDEALARARDTVYDLILMDVQMPRMDGLSAARAMRALPAHGHTPIVALTASDLVEERQQCIDANMNGHLRKPVTSATLRAELCNWLALSADAGDRAAGGSGSQKARASAPDGLDGKAMLAVACEGEGDRARERMVREYVSLHVADVPRLRDHIAAGRHAAARRLLHDLEGSSAMIGARGVELAAAALAAELRKGAEPARLDALARTFESKFEQFARSVAPARGADARH
jgi:PAS domain S-box-containing protein